MPFTENNDCMNLPRFGLTVRGLTGVSFKLFFFIDPLATDYDERPLNSARPLQFIFSPSSGFHPMHHVIIKRRTSPSSTYWCEKKHWHEAQLIESSFLPGSIYVQENPIFIFLRKKKNSIDPASSFFLSSQDAGPKTLTQQEDYVNFDDSEIWLGGFGRRFKKTLSFLLPPSSSLLINNTYRAR